MLHSYTLLVDSVLVNAGALVNDSSVVREENVPERFTYYHIELDSHALIRAEDVPAETFVDNVGRFVLRQLARARRTLSARQTGCGNGLSTGQGTPSGAAGLPCAPRGARCGPCRRKPRSGGVIESSPAMTPQRARIDQQALLL